MMEVTQIHVWALIVFWALLAMLTAAFVAVAYRWRGVTRTAAGLLDDREQLLAEYGALDDLAAAVVRYQVVLIGEGGGQVELTPQARQALIDISMNKMLFDMIRARDTPAADSVRS